MWLDAGIVPFSTLGWQNPEYVPEGYATGAAKGLTTADLPDHVLPAALHGHLHCNDCHTTWDIDADEASSLVEALERRRSFAVDVSHLSIAGRCADCTNRLED